MHSFKAGVKILVFTIVFCILAGLAGYYLEPPRTTTRILLQELYTQEEEITTLFVGASRFRRGIDPYVIQDRLGGNTLMLSFGYQTPIDSYYLLNEALKTHTPELVVLDISNRTFIEGDISWSEFILPEIKPSPDKAQYLFAAVSPEQYLAALFPVFSDTNRETYLADDFDIAANVERKESEAYKNYDFSFSTTKKSTYAGKGYIYIKTPMKTGTLGDTTFELWEDANVLANKRDHYDKAIALCKKKGIPVVLIEMPLPPATIAGQENFDGYVSYVNAYAESHDVPFFNFNLLTKEVFPQSDTCYFDLNHMSQEGAQLFSPVLAQVLDEYMQGSLNLSDYLYDSNEALLADNSRVYSTWLSKKAKGRLEAHSYHGTEVLPEYQFLYKKKESGKYKVIQDYGEAATIDISAYSTGYIRVNSRTAGSTEKWEQYDEYQIP